MINVSRVTRIEIIDEDAKRKFVRWDCEPIFMLQDRGQTLKIFMDKDGKLRKQLEEESKGKHQTK